MLHFLLVGVAFEMHFAQSVAIGIVSKRQLAAGIELGAAFAVVPCVANHFKTASFLLFSFPTASWYFCLSLLFLL